MSNKSGVVIALSFLFANASLAESHNGVNALDPHIAPVTKGDWYRPSVFVTWQWQLSGDLNTAYDVEIYDIDLFDTPVSQIQAIQALDKRVICYFSAGSYENWRPDAEEFNTGDYANTLVLPLDLDDTYRKSCL